MIITVRTNHVPFAKPPIEAMVLFHFQSISAMEYHCNCPHTTDEAAHDPERIWNAEGLSQEDLRDWKRMSALLEACATRDCVEKQVFGQR